MKNIYKEQYTLNNYILIQNFVMKWIYFIPLKQDSDITTNNGKVRFHYTGYALAYLPLVSYLLRAPCTISCVSNIKINIFKTPLRKQTCILLY